MISLIFQSLENLLFLLGRQIIIYDRDSSGSASPEPYLIRSILWQGKSSSFYIHRFLRSDHSVIHDHPYDFYSYVVKGSFLEKIQRQASKFNLITKENDLCVFYEPEYKIRGAGSLRKTTANTCHTININKRYTIKEMKDAPMTACLMLNRQREWGFWVSVSDSGVTRRFVPWYKFLGLSEPKPDHYKVRTR